MNNHTFVCSVSAYVWGGSIFHILTLFMNGGLCSLHRTFRAWVCLIVYIVCFELTGLGFFVYELSMNCTE